MTIKIASAPCCWGVDDVNNPHLPPWQRVLEEAAQAGYKGIELGPYGYIPLDVERVGNALHRQQLHIVAGTIFDDLVAAANLDSLLQQTRDICRLITRLPRPPQADGQKFAAPYLVVMDWGHPERDFQAGHSERAPRLSQQDWQRMVERMQGAFQAGRYEDGLGQAIDEVTALLARHFPPGNGGTQPNELPDEPVLG